MRTRIGEHFDVLVVGAGLSGIGAGCHLQRRCPDRSYAILEARERIGGTWDLFRYPGVRSDSDMHTLGYSFSPWEDAQAIADGPSILRYVTDTARRHGVLETRSAPATAWSAPNGAAPTPAGPSTVRRTDTGELETLTCSFLFTLRWLLPLRPGLHAAVRRRRALPTARSSIPSTGRRISTTPASGVVIIGSGATAVTLVPAMAADRRTRDDAPALAHLRRVAALA